MSALVLKAGRERSLLRRHPWIFSGAVQSVDEGLQPGDTIDILSSVGEFLARGFFSPLSQIRARVWSFHDEPIDEDFFRGRIRSALALRRMLDLASETDAVRLVHAESDGLPGLIVDRYAGALVMQCLTTGVDARRELLAGLLVEETGVGNIFERSDADVRELEGLPVRIGVLRGSLASPIFPITEHGLRFNVDLASGHKTGFYLDQRANRRQVRLLAEGRQVLDCFCYTGGFSLNALRGGAASVLAVDVSPEALRMAGENLLLNSLPPDRFTTLEGDMFQVLRKFRDERRSFDMIILDPPKFAPTSAQVEKASRGYKDINLLAFKLLRPGGLLFTFSCSGGVDADLFQKIVASAALDAGAQAQIVQHLFQAADHPVALNFPEGTYLKGLICHKTA
ncbi:MAG TPA: class I SAM-dependent methyltransferase [Anaerolineales bacterium]|nr:class I SAM-dependent methyltransferase [Anaerolineales bacterium]